MVAARREKTVKEMVVVIVTAEVGVEVAGDKARMEEKSAAAEVKGEVTEQVGVAPGKR